MGIFGNKTEENKKTDDKSASVADVKKDIKKENTKDLYKNDSKGKTAVKKESKDKEKNSGKAYKVLVRPLVTEKASIQGAQNKYFFEVAVDTNKVETAKAIKEVYGVSPISVNIINMKGKKVRRGRTTGKKKDWKKAIITLKKGESIKVYEGV